MAKTVINFALLFIGLALAQVLVFNHLILWHCALCMAFVYMYIRMPMTMTPIAAMSVGLAMGFVIDVFSDTEGMNMLASVLLCAARPAIFKLYATHEENMDKVQPSSRTMTPAPFLKYSFTMVLVYCILVYVIEAFGFFDPLRLLLRIGASTVFTYLIVIALDSVNLRLK